MLNKLFNKQTFHLIVFLIILTLGLKYVICNCNKEGYENLTKRCPNILIQKGSKFYLYNSKLTKVPGVNPLMFNNLEEYAQFIKWQRSQGIRCPVLYIQEVYDTQGKPVYKARNSPFDLQGGLPDIHINYNDNVNQNKLLDASHSSEYFNKNCYPGFDPNNQYIGLDTPLDKMFHDKNKLSPNPMDTNWGGRKYTTSLIKKGVFKGDEILVNSK